MKIPEFREIVSTKSYSCVSRDDTQTEYSWENTNKLLDKGWVGAKTGVTPHAGPCLSAAMVQGKKYYIVILLKSKSMEVRWEEAPKLAEWAMEKSRQSI